jgi:hypothetical protein
MKALRLAIAMGLVTAMLGFAPAAMANDCSDKKRPCGGCMPNPGFSLEDPRPIVCYV